MMVARQPAAPDPVGRRTRRAPGSAISLEHSRAGFEPLRGRGCSVRCELPTASTITVQLVSSACHVHATAQNRREQSERATQPWARRVLRPTGPWERFSTRVERPILTTSSPRHYAPHGHSSSQSPHATVPETTSSLPPTLTTEFLPPLRHNWPTPKLSRPSSRNESRRQIR